MTFLNPHGHPARLIRRWRMGRFTVVASEPLPDELARVLARSRLQRIRPFTTAEAQLYVLMIQTGVPIVEPTGRLRLCRDLTDDLVLETALLGEATYLVGRDADVVRDLTLIRAFMDRGSIS